MEYWHESNWYAVHTKPAREGFAATQFAALGIETFLPLLSRDSERRGRPCVLVRPLFTGYLFARFVPIASLDAVRFASGVLQVVHTGGIPIPVEVTVIDGLRARLDASGSLRLTRPNFQPGDCVSIERGPLQGLVGRIEREADDRQRVILLLDALLAARVSVAKSALSLLPAAA